MSVHKATSSDLGWTVLNWYTLLIKLFFNEFHNELYKIIWFDTCFNYDDVIDMCFNYGLHHLLTSLWLTALLIPMLLMRKLMVVTERCWLMGSLRLWDTFWCCCCCGVFLSANTHFKRQRSEEKKSTVSVFEECLWAYLTWWGCKGNGASHAPFSFEDLTSGGNRSRNVTSTIVLHLNKQRKKCLWKVEVYRGNLGWGSW